MKASEYQVLTTLSGDEKIIAFANVAGVSNNYTFTTNTVVNVLTFGTQRNVTGNMVFTTGNLSIPNDTPATTSASDEGRAINSIWADDNYIYKVTSSGVIKRVALSSF